MDPALKERLKNLTVGEVVDNFGPLKNELAQALADGEISDEERASLRKTVFGLALGAIQLYAATTVSKKDDLIVALLEAQFA